MKVAMLALSAAAVIGGLMVSTVQAVPAFKKEFETKYVVKDSTDPTVKAFAEAATKANCQICHGKDASGKNDPKKRNAYGQALDKLLDKKTDIKDAPKIQQALDTVAKEKSKPDDASSKTFGELIKEGKLPSVE